MKNIFKQEKFIPRLTFNPGLALTGFRTTRPWTFLLIFSPWRFPQAPASGVEVDQSTGLFDSSSNMFRMSMISLVGVLGVAISIGLAYHYVIFVPQRKKGKGVIMQAENLWSKQHRQQQWLSLSKNKELCCDLFFYPNPNSKLSF